MGIKVRQYQQPKNELVYYCDKCGKEILQVKTKPVDKKEMIPKCHIFYDISIVKSNANDANKHFLYTCETVLCDECKEKFENLLYGYIDNLNKYIDDNFNKDSKSSTKFVTDQKNFISEYSNMYAKNFDELPVDEYEDKK